MGVEEYADWLAEEAGEWPDDVWDSMEDDEVDDPEETLIVDADAESDDRRRLHGLLGGFHHKPRRHHFRHRRFGHHFRPRRHHRHHKFGFFRRAEETDLVEAESDVAVKDAEETQMIVDADAESEDERRRILKLLGAFHKPRHHFRHRRFHHHRPRHFRHHKFGSHHKFGFRRAEETDEVDAVTENTGADVDAEETQMIVDADAESDVQRRLFGFGHGFGRKGFGHRRFRPRHRRFRHHRRSRHFDHPDFGF